MIDRIREDIQSVFKNDPAAKTMLEVLLTYPGLHAIWIHRISHRLYLWRWYTLARLVSHWDRFIAGVKFQAFGCGAATAVSSYIAEAMQGRTLVEAKSLRIEDLTG